MMAAILALGIAGTITVFGLFNELFLRPFPVPHQERLVDLSERAPRWNQGYVGLAYDDFEALREQNQTFECMAAWASWGANLALDDETESVDMLLATHDYFDVLSLRPILGRCFTPEEDRPGGARVVLLSFGLWRRVFGQDRTVLGRILRLDNEPFTIIGVLPPAADFPVPVDLWRSLAADPPYSGGWYLMGTGRLKEGVTVEQARADLMRIHKSLIAERPANKETSPTVTPLRERYVGEYREGTSLLLGAVALVLLIACCNVASIMLARGSYRSKEMAIRAALGARPVRLAQQVLSESLVLSVIGGIGGVWLGHYALQALLTLLADEIPAWMTFAPDIRWVLFCICLVGGTTLLAGLVPAVHAGCTKALHSVLQASATRTTVSHARRRTLNAIVAGQIALALTLLVGAGLLVRSFVKVRDVDPGFRTASILTYQISLPKTQYKGSQRQAFFEEHLERVRALAGVVCAGLIDCPPMGGCRTMGIDIEGAPEKSPDEQDPSLVTLTVMPGYFEAMGIRLLVGRMFTEQDNQRAGERTVVVNETFASQSWLADNPIGKRIRFGGSDWMRVVGVTGDVKHGGLEQSVRPGIYIPYAWGRSSDMYGIVRTSGHPLDLVAPIRQTVRAMDPGLPVQDIQTMSERVQKSMWLRLTFSWLFGIFGTVAGLMAFGGIYGVVSYSASRQTQEIGIRMALGAQPRDVVLQVMRQGVLLIALGLLIGLVGAFALSRMLTAYLFGVSPTDVLTFIGVCVLVVAAAALASYIPARRAAKIDPMVALRYE
jgi:predicted permease